MVKEELEAECSVAVTSYAPNATYRKELVLPTYKMEYRFSQHGRTIMFLLSDINSIACNNLIWAKS
jgi:hypothetical protein